jgi:hypothetical protein
LYIFIQQYKELFLQAHLKASLANVTPKLLKELAKRHLLKSMIQNLLHPDNFKNTSYNSDGLINWLRQPGQIRNALKVYANKLQTTY